MLRLWARPGVAGALRKRAVGLHTTPDLASKDPWKVLGLARTATAEEAQRAYRSLAKLHHPDVHGGDAAAFQALQAAYQRVSVGGGAGGADDPLGAPPSTEPEAPPRSPGRRRPDRLQYQQLHEWWILSAGWRSAADSERFADWLARWLALEAVEGPVHAALAGDDSQLFICDDGERAHWAQQLDGLFGEWDAAWGEARGFHDRHLESFTNHRTAIPAQEVVSQRQRLEALLTTLKPKAEKKFEDLKTALMEKRASDDDDL